jgi:hypothetical protein
MAEEFWEVLGSTLYDRLNWYIGVGQNNLESSEDRIAPKTTFVGQGETPGGYFTNECVIK